ncbi:hypothetical protein M758_5G127400 [Ceratodon purpureus]|nr:hypothetical protein M758_5G127400 [Ceratodon purpureus]
MMDRSFRHRLHDFLDLYEDGVYPDPSGVDCQNILHSAIGAAALKNHNTISDLLEGASRPDGRHHGEFPGVAQDSVPTRGDATESENSSLDTQVGHSTKDYSNYVVIEQSEIERIEADVRGRKVQEQEWAVKMANQLQQSFAVWQRENMGTAIEACSRGEYQKHAVHGHVMGGDSLVDSSSTRNSTDALDYVSLCEFLVDLELGKLESKNEHGARQSEGVATSSPDMDPHVEAVSDIVKENGRTASLTSRQRLLSVENAVDEVADHKLQQKLSYLLEFRGKLDEENWRAGVDMGLIFAYFKVLLEFLMNQITASVTHLADVKHQLMSNQEDLQITKDSLVDSRCEVENLRTENTVLSFVDQLTEEIESCEAEISKEVELRSEREDQGANVKTLMKKIEETEWEHAAEMSIYSEVLNETAISCLQEQQDTGMKMLRKKLEEIEWTHAAESLIFLEFLNEAKTSCLRKQQDESLKMMAVELQETNWEHAVESSVYLAMLNETGLSYSQESIYLKEKLREESKLQERLKKEVAELGRLTGELEDSAWTHMLESCISLEILDDITLQYSQELQQLSAKLSIEETHRGRLQKEVEELNKRVKEFEFSSWKSTMESSIYLAIFDDVESKLLEEIEYLRAELGIQGASLVKLQVLHAELERSMEELESISIGQKAETSFCLEIVDAVAEEWALDVNRALSEFRRNERALEAALEQKDIEIKKLTEELELTLWEHEAESSIYLEVVGERACEWRQLIDNLAGAFNRKQIVRRKELQASSSFSGRTQKDNLAFEDASALVQGDIEGLKSAMRKPSSLKGLSTLSDQAVSSPGKATDPIYVVVRRNTQAAVEGFMVDIGESPSKRTNKEVVSSLKLEVLDLRREKEQLIDHYTGELNKLEFELRKRMKVELEQEFQDEFSRLQIKLESQYRNEAELMKNELNQNFQIQIADLQEKLESEYMKRSEAREVEFKKRCQNETTELQEKLELEYRNLIEKKKDEVEQSHRNEIADLQETLELEHRREAERVKVELQQKHENDLANLRQKLDDEATKKSEWKLIELEQKFQIEIAALEGKLVNVKQKLEQGLHDKKRQQSSSEGGGNASTEISRLDESRESPTISLKTMGSMNDTLLPQFELEVVRLVAERDELCDRVSIMEHHICELQEKVTKLEGERSWLEERVPGLEKKLATEQSRLEDTVAGHAFERDQLKLIVSSHKNEQTKLENELAERKAERNYLATAIAMLSLACRNLKVSNQNERERWRSAYMMALKDMERALSRTQKQVKEERAQKGSAESDAQRMKAEIYTMQQESKDVWRLLERTIAEHISRAVGTSQQVEFGLCRKIHQQTLRFEAVQQQVDNLLQVLRRSQMSEMDYLHTVENLQRAEQEVDVLGDEVDSLVALLEKVHVVMDQYAPVLLHYPGVAEVAKLVEYELHQRDMLPSVPT